MSHIEIKNEGIIRICLVVLVASVLWLPTSSAQSINYREEMRNFVVKISNTARGSDSDFIVIPQNGHELLTTTSGDASSPVATQYIAAISGVGREDLFYGYEEDNVATPTSVRNEIIEYMDLAEANGVEVLVTDYCSTLGRMDDSYEQNNSRGYISFAADERDLNNIPIFPAIPFNVNSGDISSLSEAANFLYLLDPGNFNTKDDFLSALRATSYDVIIMDAFFGDQILTASDVASLKTKARGGDRIVVSYMSIGEAEDYRFYWESEWSTTPPAWLDEENPDWKGNFKVRYWDSDWQDIIAGDSTNSYLKQILAAGFDGVYLDIIDAYEFFEENNGGSVVVEGAGEVGGDGGDGTGGAAQNLPEGLGCFGNSNGDKSFPGDSLIIICSLAVMLFLCRRFC